jgi:hypothetical protein
MPSKKTVNTVETTVVKSEKRGRPAVEGSARQAKLAARAARVAAGGSVERGRPSNPTSARQARLAAQAERVSRGIDIKVGRPKGSKAVITTEVVEAVEA